MLYTCVLLAFLCFFCESSPVTKRCPTERRTAKNEKTRVELYSVASRGKVAIASDNSITTIHWLDRSEYDLQFEWLRTMNKGGFYFVLRTMSGLYLGINAAGSVVLQVQYDVASVFTLLDNMLTGT